MALHAPELYPLAFGDARYFFARTGIEPLYTRPRTPNDNPQIEAFFSTMKGRPDYPARFEAFVRAQMRCERFSAGTTTSTTTGASST